MGKDIQGAIDPATKQHALAWLRWIGERNTAVAAMLGRPDILLLVMITPGHGDQDTSVEWKAGRTQITVNLYFAGGTATGLEGDLLHELVLHAEPAALKHVAAVDRGAVPAHATDGRTIRAEEAAEHADGQGWYRMVRLALERSEALVDKAVADAASHGEAMAAQLIQRLLREQRITAEQAEELQVLVDGDDSDSGGADGIPVDTSEESS